LTLANLKRCDRARICDIDAAQQSVQRLMIMGLVEGTEKEISPITTMVNSKIVHCF